MADTSEIKRKAQELVARYAPLLAAHGVQCKVSQKYREDTVMESSGRGAWLFRSAERAREQERYHNQNNRYKVLVLSFSPQNSKRGDADRFCDYAFLLEKTERAHTGQEPMYVLVEEERLLAQVEKRLHKMLARAEKYDAEKACRDGIGDLFRYHFSGKYIYKETILGKDTFFWDMLFMGIAVALVLVVVGIPALIFG